MLKLLGLFFLVVFIYSFLKGFFMSGHKKNNTPSNRNGYAREVDHYENRCCCGNCRHNMDRRAEGYWTIYCTWDAKFHRDLSFSQKDVCNHWEHF